MVKKTLYDVLQVSRNADPETIKAAYKSLVQRYHPDRNPDNPETEKILQEINRAYEVLSSPMKRAAYDVELAYGDGDQAAGSSESSGFSAGAAPAGNGAYTKGVAPADRSVTTAKKRGYLWMLDFFPMAAVAQLFKSLVVTRFHGSPDASGWAVFFAMLFGSGIGIVLFQYIRTKTTKKMQNQRTVFFVSLSLSIVFTLAIATTTVLLERSAIHTNPLVDISSDFAPATPIVAPPASPGTELQQTMALAEQGNAEAQAKLGYAYETGQVVPQNYLQAMIWHRKAADQGDAFAQYNLGAMYENGWGVPKDYTQAMKWYRRSADQGNADAQDNLAYMYANGRGVPKDYTQAMKWYHRSADQGNADAQFNLGVMYDKGQGVPQDYAQAMMWFHKAADHGDATAQLILGGMYAHGQGVPQDFAQAMMWYRKAAAQGDATAQFGLGTMYLGGEGVPKDDAQAMMWFLIAKASGDTFANQTLQGLESLSTPAQIAEAKKMAQEWLDAHPMKK